MASGTWWNNPTKELCIFQIRCVVMVHWFVVNRDPEDYATAFAAEALVGKSIEPLI